MNRKKNGDGHTYPFREGFRTLWGAGIDADISTASLKAIVSAVNRALRFETKAPALVGAQ